jgi:hypothetical protein
MIGEKRLDFSSRSNVISGNVAGKTLHCVIRAGGALPLPGTYQIMAPLSDPVYGKYAFLVPMAGQIGMPALDGASKGAAYLSLKFNAGVTAKADSARFVLTAQPMIGRNSLVIAQGFADLIAALEAAGGAYVTIA